MNELFGVEVHKTMLIPEFKKLRGKKQHFQHRALQRVLGYRISGFASVAGKFYVRPKDKNGDIG